MSMLAMMRFILPPGIDKRMGVGLEWFARENISVKSELRSRHAHTNGHRDDTEIQVQISFGF